MQALLKFGDWVKIDKLGMKLHETAVFLCILPINTHILDVLFDSCRMLPSFVRC